MNTKIAPRERIVLTAMRLFNSVGVHAAGIDRIIEESCVAKKTFYNHFSSKNKLIAEYYRRKDAAWFARLENATSDKSISPLERLLCLFDELKIWFHEGDFSGCPFIKGVTDFSDENHDPEINKYIADHFKNTEILITTLLKPVRPDDYKNFIPQMMSLIVGTVVMAYITGKASIADVNKRMAKVLLESAPVSPKT